jgi:hypothetical protein
VERVTFPSKEEEGAMTDRGHGRAGTRWLAVTGALAIWIAVVLVAGTVAFDGTVVGWLIWSIPVLGLLAVERLARVEDFAGSLRTARDVRREAAEEGVPAGL